MTQHSTTEGWGWPAYARQAHYFREGRSLCRRWGYGGILEIGNDGSTDNCKGCMKKLKAEKSKPQTSNAGQPTETISGKDRSAGEVAGDRGGD